jgi:hypothetical protein
MQIRAVPRCRKRVKRVLLSADFAKSGVSGAGDARNDPGRLVEFLHLTPTATYLVSISRDRLARNSSAPL